MLYRGVLKQPLIILTAWPPGKKKEALFLRRKLVFQFFWRFVIFFFAASPWYIGSHGLFFEIKTGESSSFPRTKGRATNFDQDEGLEGR